MYMNEVYKRRIRIESPPDGLYGRDIKIIDLDTQEEITNITDITLYPQAREMSYANITYYEYDENGKLAGKDGEPIIKTSTLSNPEIAVSALELSRNLHQIGMIDDTLFRCAVCGGEWLFNPLIFRDRPNAEKRAMAHCPGAQKRGKIGG